MSGHELAMAIRGAYLALHRRTDALVSACGVTADQFVVLAALTEGEAMTQRELVARTSSDPNTLRAMLVLLEGQNLIERRTHPTDRRARRVSLTRKGRTVFRRAWRKSEALRERLQAALGDEEVESMVTQLGRLVAAMEQDQAEAVNAGRRPAASSRDR